ncbi:MAG: two-component system, OmpR family, sensor kinase [Gaiellaceae bacterium]|nr:two-component system, OmpR family, sensor kinase [Gaiellaceae bacterium]
MSFAHPWRDVRGRLLTVVLTALVIALAVAIYGFNRVFTATSERNANELVQSRAASALATVDFAGGHIRVREPRTDAEIDSRVWIFDGKRAVEAPAARPSVAAAARSLASGPARFVDVASADIRLYSLPIVFGGVRRGTAVAATSLAPYEQTQRTALVDSLVLAVVLLLVVGAAVWWLLAAAFRPVVRMTEQAEVWSERELDRRFNLGPPHDELTRLGSTLDRLLDRLAASLRHERRFSAELSHELRTPLARIMAESELALRRDRTPSEYRGSLEDVRRNAGQVSRIVDTLVAAFRHEASAATGTSDAYTVASEVQDHCGPLAAERDVVVEVDAPDGPLRIGVDGDLAERILEPVVENAIRYGRSRVQIRLSRSDSRVLFSIEDDGAGVRPDEQEAIFEPGTRGSAGNGDKEGAGLGLALSRRLARSASGDVETVMRTSGALFTVRLPAA